MVLLTEHFLLSLSQPPFFSHSCVCVYVHRQEQDWDRFTKISITAKVLIRQHLNEVKLGQKRGSRANPNKGLSQAEKLACIHKIRR
jgi:neutral trehalase